MAACNATEHLMCLVDLACLGSHAREHIYFMCCNILQLYLKELGVRAASSYTLCLRGCATSLQDVDSEPTCAYTCRLGAKISLRASTLAARAVLKSSV